MPYEIERKFLLRGDDWKNAPYKELMQGYIVSGEGVVVRIRTAGERAFITIKKHVSGFSRSEYEYGIPHDEAVEMLRNVCQQPIIEKRRYEIEFEGHTWEVDEFFGVNEGLCLAEIELDSEDADFPLPPWIGEEVTFDSRYFNSYLARSPYSQWTDHEKSAILNDLK